jgi:holo-[acyl-carrier protein] synthase
MNRLTTKILDFPFFSLLSFVLLYHQSIKVKKMITGLGCDIVDVSRFDKGEFFLNRFIWKYFTNIEYRELSDKNSLKGNKLLLAVATRFAAKEAVSKALGTGFRDGLTLKDIEIIHNELGAPSVVLYNKALERAYFLSHSTEFKIHITLSNEKHYANAVAIFEVM